MNRNNKNNNEESDDPYDQLVENSDQNTLGDIKQETAR
jgi:hypothetical protein